MSSELKACPFCGADNGWQASGRVDGKRGSWVCHVCNARGPTADRPMMGSDAAIMAAWNRRTPSPAVMALVEACRALVKAAWPTHTDSERIEQAEKALAAVEREIGGA